MKIITNIFILLLIQSCSSAYIAKAMSSKIDKHDFNITQDESYLKLKAAYWRNQLRQTWDRRFRIHVPTKQELKNIMKCFPPEWPKWYKEKCVGKVLKSCLKAHLHKLKVAYLNMLLLRDTRKGKK